MQLRLIHDDRAGIAVIEITLNDGHRVEIRGSTRVGIDAPSTDPVQALIDRLSGPGASQLFAGDALHLHHGKPGRTAPDYRAVLQFLDDDGILIRR